jgi:DNA-binding GntR family transcriptional regulator
MIDPTPLSQQIQAELKEEIISGRLRPNQKILIEELAQKWKVSTTPVRDAVRNLELAGFVIVSPRKSITVANLDLKAFKDVFDLRIALECCGVELAINRIPAHVIENALESFQHAYEKYKTSGNLDPLEQVDNVVHQIILDYCDNEKLVAMMDQLHDLISWARRIVINQPKSFGEAAGEHIQILEHLKSRQVQLAVQAMRTHLANSFERTQTYWNDNQPDMVSRSQGEMHL